MKEAACYIKSSSHKNGFETEQYTKALYMTLLMIVLKITMMIMFVVVTMDLMVVLLFMVVMMVVPYSYDFLL